MGYARWTVTRSGDRLRVRVETPDPMTHVEIDALWLEISRYLDDRTVRVVVVQSDGTWIVMHRHPGRRPMRWHLRSAATAGDASLN